MMRGASAGDGFKAQAPVSGFRAQRAVSGFRFQGASAGFRFDFVELKVQVLSLATPN